MTTPTTMAMERLRQSRRLSSITARHRDELIPVLQDVNRAVGYLPSDALEEISRLMHFPRARSFPWRPARIFPEKLAGMSSSSASAPCHVVGGLGCGKPCKILNWNRVRPAQTASGRW